MKQLHVLTIVVASLLVAAAHVSAQAARSFTSGRFALTLDGQQIGFVNSLDGGNAVAAVTTQAVGPSLLQKKQITNIRFDPISVQIGVGMGKPIYQWIASTVRGEQRRSSGSIIGFDTQLTAVQQRDFSNALITEVTFPKLDGSSKDPAYLTVVLAPERVEQVKSSGARSGAIAARQKNLVASNFRLEIDGLDTARVSKIEAFTIKQKVAADSIGETREPQTRPVALELSDLTITFSAASADTWQRWFDEFVLQGRNDDSREKSGRLVLLAPNMQDELLVITFSNIGIYALRQLNPASNTETISQLEAKLYIERLDLTVP